MGIWRDLFWSSVGKKFISGLTGLFLVVFVVAHLAGNFTLLIGGDAFNEYAHFIESLAHGWVLPVFEVGLATVFILHILSGASVALIDKYRARPVRYAVSANAGHTSRKGISSRTMIISGLVLLIFVIAHVIMFRFGDARLVPAGNGGAGGHGEMRDLYALVVQAFKQEAVTAGYVAVMIVLGIHLRHGFWSAFQSLGWTRAGSVGSLTTLALVIAILLAVGFLLLPVYIYAFADPPAALQAAGGGGQ